MNTENYYFLLDNIQGILSKYIFSKGFVSWSGIKKACSRIIESLPDSQKGYFKDKKYPEFNIFIPLLRNGTAEACRSKDRATLLYCMNPTLKTITEHGKECVRNKTYHSMYIIENQEKAEFNSTHSKQAFSSLKFLKSYTTISDQIKIFPEQDINISSFRVEQDLYNYQYKRINSPISSTGIYKCDDMAWNPSYLIDEKRKPRKILFYAENPDSINLARLYVRLTNCSIKKPIFEYDNKKNELTCLYYSELPILFTRALLLIEPRQLMLKEFCTNNPDIPFKNISMDIVKEIGRIFSRESVKMIS